MKKGTLKRGTLRRGTLKQGTLKRGTMEERENEIYIKALIDLNKPLHAIWATLASEEPLNLREVRIAIEIVDIIIKNAPNEGLKMKWKMLLDALNNPEKKGNVISDIIDEFYR